MLSPLVDDDNIEVGIGDAVLTGPPDDTMDVACGCCCGGWLTDIVAVSLGVLSLLIETGGCPAEVGCPADVGCCPTDTGCCCRVPGVGCWSTAGGCMLAVVVGWPYEPGMGPPTEE